jgi:hypothetical protein
LAKGDSAEGARLQISVWENSVPVQVIPQEGWLSFRIHEEHTNW